MFDDLEHFLDIDFFLERCLLEFTLLPGPWHWGSIFSIWSELDYGFIDRVKQGFIVDMLKFSQHLLGDVFLLSIINLLLPDYPLFFLLLLYCSFLLSFLNLKVHFHLQDLTQIWITFKMFIRSNLTVLKLVEDFLWILLDRTEWLLQELITSVLVNLIWELVHVFLNCK